MAQSPDPTPPNSASTVRRWKGCSKIGEYDILSKLGEGTFGEVHKARQMRTGAIVAMKKILMHHEKDGFPITALREIKLLKMLCHDNVLKLEEMAVERKKEPGRQRAVLYVVTPYMDHDLSGLLCNPDVQFSEPQIKCYMLQLFKGLQYLHDSHILHRDMKAANLLINNRGRLQIADFGLARHYEEDVPRAGKGNGEARRDYTQLVVTRWYRPPELLLGLRKYTPAIDMWGAGCVFGEMFKRKPILAGKTDLNQAHIIFDLVGNPTEANMPGWSALPGCENGTVKQFEARTGNLPYAFRELNRHAISLLSDLLKLDWKRRINAIDAIHHPYFKEYPLPMRETDIPRFADSHELDRRETNGQRPLPPAPAGGAVGMPDWNDNASASNSQHTGPWNNDRDRARYHDRGPPGVPQPPRNAPYDRHRPYDHRPPPPPPSRPQHSAYRPSQGLPYDDAPRHPLPNPPRYPGPERRREDYGDKYVPRYDAARDDRRSRELDDVRSRDGRRGSRDSGHSHHREFGRDRRGTRSRSRSPGAERERERERVRDVYRR